MVVPPIGWGGRHLERRQSRKTPGHPLIYTSCFSVDIAWLAHVVKACQLRVHRCSDMLQKEGNTAVVFR